MPGKYQQTPEILILVSGTLNSKQRASSRKFGLDAESCPPLATPWTVAHQTPLSMGFSRQEYWSGLPFPSPEDLQTQVSCIGGRFFTNLATREKATLNLQRVQSTISIYRYAIIISPHSSLLAWKIPWMEEPGRLQSMGSLRVRQTERLHFHLSLSCTGEGNGNPLQCSCLENPRDGGAWWADVYGVAQSRTRLK